MEPQLTFQIVNTLALPGWFLLLFFPNSNVTYHLVKRGLIPIILALFYVFSIMLGYQGFSQGGGFSTLSAVRTLFQNDWALVAGWVHYLCFDLLIGTQVVNRISRRGFLVRFLSLSLTFLFGPIGWLISHLFSAKSLGRQV